MSTRQLRRYCVLDAEGRALLQAAMDELGVSARAHDRILRVARTIADLEGSADLQAPHVVEAIGYRSLDRKLWQR
jgi:magnesium chelatase family protein